ncbi:basic salivary proline-rich protein 2-like [Tympanuchus pallidicinctus]|uniref:basic salivary proline-rich protein 2-like n=1 Tax=Tympanuchus pallidicinctus TaxID=109042 RepID=UPI002287176D|nr:basic salivary proline-rich protein 2-like [Tympanuchus pallidicinctus]
MERMTDVLSNANGSDHRKRSILQSTDKGRCLGNTGGESPASGGRDAGCGHGAVAPLCPPGRKRSSGPAAAAAAHLGHGPSRPEPRGRSGGSAEARPPPAPPRTAPPLGGVRPGTPRRRPRRRSTVVPRGRSPGQGQPRTWGAVPEEGPSATERGRAATGTFLRGHAAKLRAERPPSHRHRRTAPHRESRAPPRLAPGPPGSGRCRRCSVCRRRILRAGSGSGTRRRRGAHGAERHRRCHRAPPPPAAVPQRDAANRPPPPPNTPSAPPLARRPGTGFHGDPRPRAARGRPLAAVRPPPAVGAGRTGPGLPV